MKTEDFDAIDDPFAGSSTRDLERLADLSDRVTEKFSAGDWRKLGMRTGFLDDILGHNRLLRSLEFGDDDYHTHAFTMLERIFRADSRHLSVIESMVAAQPQRLSADEPQRYVRGRLLGQGGFGSVYLERDTLLGLDFARKELDPSNFATTDFRARFVREASLLFRLRHPNIIGVHHVSFESGTPFIRMEYFDGAPLSKLEVVEPDRAIRIISQVASALVHAHERKVIHRDLKPSNVLVSGNEVRVIDFGLGAFVDAERHNPVTRTGEVVNSGSYAAPELVDLACQRDPRCDVFSLGGLYFRLLTGRDPIGADQREQLKEIDGLPRDHVELVMRALSRVDQRVESASAFLDSVRVTNEAAHNVRSVERSSADRLMMAIASLFPEAGATIPGPLLRQTARQYGLLGQLEYSFAFKQLEEGHLIEKHERNGELMVALSRVGRIWLDAHGPRLVKYEREDAALIPF